MTNDQINNIFTFHPPIPEFDQVKRYEAIRDAGGTLARSLNTLCPDSRELSLAITNIQQAIMWANAAIAINETKDTLEEREEGSKMLPEIYIRIAEFAHEINRAYCNALDDHSQVPWYEAPDWMKNSTIDGVMFHHRNPDALPSASHENWLEEKELNGWKYGPVKDEIKKEHPCYVPYEDLPVEQKAKDFIFKAVCENAFRLFK